MSWPSGDVRREARVALLRRAASAGAAEVNGIVEVEVAQAGDQVQVVCELVFAPAAAILESDVAITGGVRRPRVAVTRTQVVGRTLTIDVAERGDFSLYALALRRDGALLPGFDPLLSAITVSFRLDCQQGFDCRAEPLADAPPPASAPIDYLARDYDGFRRLMLDRFAQLTPGWREPGAASPEVTLIEMLAHVADRLAYAQDAVATEAYLDTARRRVSAKRHARLVDYPMGEGSNARAFVHVRLRPTAPGTAPLVATVSIGTRFMTRTQGVAPASGETPEVLAGRAAGSQVFEALEQARLSSAHNRLLIHDWQEGVTLLPKGSTAMAVVDAGRGVALAAGDLLLIEEVLDDDGNASPDPARRHVVRLTEVAAMIDPVGAIGSGGDPAPLEILHLRWSSADALPMDLPLLRRTSTDTVDDIPPSTGQPTLVARGNMVVVDHGEWRGSETLEPQRRPGRRRIVMPLSAGPVTMQPPHDAALSAAASMAPAGRPLGQLSVTRDAGAGSDPAWQVVDEIFEEAGQQLVLDIGDDGRAALRTGSLASEASFDEAVPFLVRYRLGNGTLGNVGAEAIAHVLTDPHTGADGALIAGLTARPGDVALVRNPLPAQGGTDTETIDQVRLRAPITFRRQDRAVTGEDYVRFLLEDPLVAGAKAVEQWTGSARAIVLLVDLVGGGSLEPAIEQRLRDRLERVRLAGHVLEFRDPVLVPLEIAMRVCVRQAVPRRAVLKRMAQLFSSGRLPDGTPALFHPDNFGFGTSLRLSRLYAAAQAIDGVVHVEITSLRRQSARGDDAAALETGTLDFGAYEIPLLANDPNFPDRGVVHFTLEGGA